MDAGLLDLDSVLAGAGVCHAEGGVLGAGAVQEAGVGVGVAVAATHWLLLPGAHTDGSLLIGLDTGTNVTQGKTREVLFLAVQVALIGVGGAVRTAHWEVEEWAHA